MNMILSRCLRLHLSKGEKNRSSLEQHSSRRLRRERRGTHHLFFVFVPFF